MERQIKFFDGLNHKKYLLNKEYEGFGIYDNICPTGYRTSQSYLLKSPTGTCILSESYMHNNEADLLDLIDEYKKTGKYNIPVIPKIYEGNTYYVWHQSGKVMDIEGGDNTRFVWLIGVSSSEAEGIHMERVRGTEAQVKEYLFDLVEEDRQCEPELWEAGTESVDQVYYPDQSHSSLYAYGSYVDCHIDYVATKEPDIIELH